MIDETLSAAGVTGAERGVGLVEDEAANVLLLPSVADAEWEVEFQVSSDKKSWAVSDVWDQKGDERAFVLFLSKRLWYRLKLNSISSGKMRMVVQG